MRVFDTKVCEDGQIDVLRYNFPQNLLNRFC